MQHDYFSSLSKPDHCFPVLSLLLLLSLLKLLNMNKLKGDLVSSTVAYMYSSHTLSTLIKKKHFLFTWGWGWGWLHIGNIYSITQMKLTALLQGSHLSISVSWLKREVQEMPCSFHYYHNEMHKKNVIRNCCRLLYFKIHDPIYTPSNRNSKVENWQHSCPHISCKEISYDSRCYGGVTSFTYSNYTT